MSKLTFPKRSRETLNQMEQTLHNLKQQFPTGLKRLDDERDSKIKALEAELKAHGRIK